MNPLKTKNEKHDFSSIMLFSYLSFRGLMVKTPDSQSEDRGSNPAGGKKVLQFLPLFTNFQEVLWLSANNRKQQTHKKWKNKGQRISEPNSSVSGFAFSPWNFSLFCVVNLNKIIIKWLNNNTFLTIFSQQCIQNWPKVINLIENMSKIILLKDFAFWVITCLLPTVVVSS